MFLDFLREILVIDFIFSLADGVTPSASIYSFSLVSIINPVLSKICQSPWISMDNSCPQRDHMSWFPCDSPSLCLVLASPFTLKKVSIQTINYMITLAKSCNSTVFWKKVKMPPVSQVSRCFVKDAFSLWCRCCKSITIPTVSKMSLIIKVIHNHCRKFGL